MEAGEITGKDVPFCIFGNIIAGFIGAKLGTSLLGSWGPPGGFAILPALVGAIILILIVSLVLRAIKK